MSDYSYICTQCGTKVIISGLKLKSQYYCSECYPEEERPPDATGKLIEELRKDIVETRECSDLEELNEFCYYLEMKWQKRGKQ